ncbi:MAG: TetR family transcriptional regulator [Firmicutes bacterium]|nr:TetR family transcriptional regulator [Bacillota bacterium]
MSNNEDLRIIKTRLAIKGAFFDMLAVKSFEKITVSDITDKALINRGTFYSHYKDKYDLMEQIENEVLDDIGNFVSLLTEESIDKAFHENQPLPHIIPLLKYTEENAQCLALFTDGNTSSFCERIVNRYFDEINNMLHLPQDKWLPYRKTIMISLVSGMLNQWISDNMSTPKEELAGWMTEIVKANWNTFKTKA